MHELLLSRLEADVIWTTDTGPNGGPDLRADPKRAAKVIREQADLIERLEKALTDMLPLAEVAHSLIHDRELSRRTMRRIQTARQALSPTEDE